jgi:hypothetical protein
MLAVPESIRYFTLLWENSPDRTPVFKKYYSKAEQLEKEMIFEEFYQKINAFKSAKHAASLRDGDPSKTFFPLFRSFLQTVFDYENDQLEIILSDKFKNVSRDFFYQARAFGPELSPENIYQGLRNVWIMNGLQLMMGLPVEITPSVFAYSMIYPYSDNFLDDPQITGEEKEAFSNRFNQRLHGQPVQPLNFTEEQLFRLVEMFETQYPRVEFPEVYESLYAIQKAQTNSLALNHHPALCETKVLEICFEKGGASVMADGYLVAGRLTRQQERALFGYGIYLQLLDDIQDVKEDAEACTRTLFSGHENNTSDAFVNKTIHFGRKALDEMRCFPGPEPELMLRLMNRSIENMIIESVGMNDLHFSASFLNEYESHSPLRFQFVRNKRSEAKSHRFALFQKYFEKSARQPVNAV